MTLHEALAPRVAAWKAAGYPVEDVSAIAEILEWAHGTEDTGNVRFLRQPQLRALETYWYLRLVEGTPHVLDLYKSFYTGQTALLKALGLDHPGLRDKALDLGGADALIEAVRSDDDLVRAYRLEAIRETLNLDYPSYILALAMGAGKTILIGSIIATYDGQVLNVVTVDVPERKTDYVKGRYEFAVPKGKTTVAVRITDMLGEEVLVTKAI